MISSAWAVAHLIILETSYGDRALDNNGKGDKRCKREIRTPRTVFWCRDKRMTVFFSELEHLKPGFVGCYLLGLGRSQAGLALTLR
jgi:hypothetical protein